MRVGLLLASLCAGVASAADEPKVTVITTKDVKYRTGTDADKVRHALDVYAPKGATDAPVLFLVHGGRWEMGSKDYFNEVGEAFAKRGIVCVCPNYRLSPKVKHPAHIEDVATAFAWTAENAAKHGGDPKKIVIAGHSAGGHLVSLLATDEKYLKAEKRSLADVRGVLGISGVYTIVPLVFDSMFGSDADVCRAASPFHNIHARCPPYVLFHADNDLPFLGGMAKEMGKALAKAKCEAEVCEIKGRDHIMLMYKANTPADPVFEKMEAAIRKWTK